MNGEDKGVAPWNGSGGRNARARCGGLMSLDSIGKHPAGVFWELLGSAWMASTSPEHRFSAGNARTTVSMALHAVSSR